MTERSLIENGEIILSGHVIDDELAGWGFSGFAPSDVRQALAAFAGEPVTIRLNSRGGFAAEGEAIRALIARHDGEVRLVIEGSAQSAASLLALGADRVEISAGSFVMIHDPSSCACGAPDQLRSEADALDVLADGYAGVYAARLGVSPADARALMKAETYFSASEAVANGFADAVSEGEAPAAPVTDMTAKIAQLRSEARADARALAQAYQDFKASGTVWPGSPNRAAACGAEQEPSTMTTPSPLTSTPPSTPPATPPAPDMSAERDAARRAERARISAIQMAAAPFVASGMLSQEDVTGFIDGDVTAEAAKATMLDRVSERQAAASAGPRTQIIRDEGETRIAGMIGAMCGETDGPAGEFRGLRLKSLARMLGGNGHNETETIRRGMASTAIMGGAHGVSDFSHITTQVMGRTLTAEYQRRAPNWRVVTGAPIPAADFRELAPTTFGGDFSLKTVKENGEYHSAVLDDRGEGLKVERRGRTIVITFEAVVNDDMGAFRRIPGNFALAARQMESSMVWGLIRANAKLKSDDMALFHASHGNLASAAAISVASVGAMRKLMWDQKAQGTKAEDDFIRVVPDLLILPPALETVGLQFVAGTTPGKDSDTNPYKGTMTPVIVPELGAAVSGGSDLAWYMGSSDMPAINAAYLDGYEGPTVMIEDGMNPDRVVMNARHIFGAAPGEPRGMAKNPGAAAA